MADEGSQPYDALDAAERGIEVADDFAPRTRRRGRKSNSAIARLKAGRDAILNDDADDGDVYEEIDADEYEQLRRRRLEEAEFIVDDGDGDYDGYFDDGRDFFEEEDMLGDSTAAQRARRKKAGGTRQTGGVRKKKEAPKRRVNSLFTGGKSSRLGATVVKMAEDTGAGGEDKLLAEVLGQDQDGNDDDEDIAKLIAMRRAKKKKSGLTRLALFGSAADARNAFMQGEDGDDDQDMIMPPAQPVMHRRAAAQPRPAQSYAVAEQEEDNFDAEMQDQAYRAPSPYREMGGPEPEFGSMDDNKPTEEEDKEEQAKPQAAASPAKPAPSKSSVRVVAMPMDEDEDDDDDETSRRNYLRASAPKVDSSDDWKRVRKAEDDAKQPAQNDVVILPKALPLEEDENGEKVLRMYWLDAHEPEGHMNGTIYLFGKVYVKEADAFVSCAAAVTNLERNLFVLPRETKLDDDGNPTNEAVEMVDVYHEMRQVLSKHGVEKFLSKPVSRNYAFEHDDVPSEATFLKIKYSASLPKLPGDLSGKTFSHVFGSNVSALERFIMKRDLMGPCWLEIRGCEIAKRSYSWCKLEVEVGDPKTITKVAEPPAAPPLTVLSLSMQTILNQKHHVNEILAICGLVHRGVELDGSTAQPEKGFTHFTAIRKLGDNPFPFDLKSTIHKQRRQLETMPSERSLLGFLMAKIAKVCCLRRERLTDSPNAFPKHTHLPLVGLNVKPT